MNNFWDKVKKAWTDAYNEVTQGAEAAQAEAAQAGHGPILEDWAFFQTPPQAQPQAQPQHKTLLEEIQEASDYTWTEEEMQVWLSRIDVVIRRQIMASAKRVVADGGDPLEFLCKLRIKLEAQQKQQEQEENTSTGGGILGGLATLNSLGWAWDEAMLMGAQREFFDRENKKARGW